MKKLFLKLGLISLVFGVSLFALGSANAESVATLKDIQGEVFVQTAGSNPDSWQPVSQETAVNSGDSVKTGSGSCVLSYSTQGEFKVGANTAFTVQENSATQDIVLKLGSLKAKINKANVVKPFQVVTPTAVGAVRGTDVDFDFNDQGQLTVDLHDGGPVQVYNDEAGMDLTLEGGNKISVLYNKETGEVTVTNSCDSAGKINFSILGKEYSIDKCGSQTVGGNTAAGATNPPGTNQGNEGNENNPNENSDNDTPPPSSPTQ